MPGLTLSPPLRPSGDVEARLSMRPSDMPQGHASGPAPHRFLLVGADAVAGSGVRSHELSLIGSLARSVSRRTGHGTDVEGVVSERSSVRQLDDLLRQQRVSGLDGVVLVLEAGRHGRTPASYGAELRTLLIALVDRLPEGVPVTVVAAPPLNVSRAGTDRDGDRFRAFGDVVASAIGPLATFVALGPAAAPALELYRGWADTIADALLPALREPQLWSSPGGHVEEGARQRAVTRMGPLDAAWEAQFERFVTFARGAYGTRSAALSVLDGSSTRFMVSQGVEVATRPREDTLCSTALTSPGGLIVGDARADERFQHLPVVEDGDAAFYAGHVVESPDGQPVAVLCVFDPEPRPVLSQDIALLRDLALAAQRRVWELAKLAPR